MLKPLGDSALLLQLGGQIDPALNGRVHALNALLQTNTIPGILETVPAYSTYLCGGLGSAIHAGDILQIGKPANELGQFAAQNFPVEKYLNYSQSPVIKVIPGPQKDRLSEDGILKFHQKMELKL